MWKGKVTVELDYLFDQYAKAHYGIEPDSYDDLDYDAMDYEEFVGYIKESLEKGVELPYVVPYFDGMTYEEFVGYMKESLGRGVELPDMTLFFDD